MYKVLFRDVRTYSLYRKGLRHKNIILKQSIDINQTQYLGTRYYDMYWILVINYNDTIKYTDLFPVNK